MKKRKLLMLTAFLLISLFHLTGENTFAGVNLANGPDPQCVREPCPNPNATPTPQPLMKKDDLRREQKQFALAQTRNERGQPPGAGTLRGGDTQTRTNFSFFLSISVLFGGIWALVALLRQRFKNRSTQSRANSTKIWKFVFQPQFALSAFAFLFLTAIIGGTLTEPTAVKAGKRQNPNKLDKSKMVGRMNPSNKPVFKSAQVIRSNDATQIGTPVFDSMGNRYVRGGFIGTLDVYTSKLQASRFFDAFFVKYDQFGTEVWARQASGATSGITAANSIEAATALAVDQSGNVYVGGSFVKTVTLQGGENADITLNDNGAAGVNYESFIAKYDANGNLLWARGGNSGSPKSPVDLEIGQNAISQIVFDSSGNPYITGVVSGGNFLGSAATNAGQTDIVLARLNPANGAIVWKKIVGGTEVDAGIDLEIDAANNLYLLGNFKSDAITFPTVPATTFTNTDDSINTFIAKFDSSGANVWAREIDNANTVSGSQIAVNQTGEIFITGSFFDSAEFGKTLLYEKEGEGDEDEKSFGGYLAKMDTNGDFVWAEGFAGLGETIALDPNGKVYVVGTFYDGGVFGFKSPNEEALASFGGEDIFVARYTTDGGFEWAKPIAGNGYEGTIAVGNTGDLSAPTMNSYNPLGIGYNPASGTMFISGDFQRAIALDCITLTNDGNIQAYIAEIGADGEPTSCRIWNGLDEDDNDFDSPDNWNDGILPSAEDSIYVPYTGNDYDPPTFNPEINIPLKNVTIADDRILTLEKRLTITDNLYLLGGFVDAENFPLFLGEYAGAFSTADGLVLGRVEKEIPAENSGFFKFPVGTADGKGYAQYSPVTISNIMGSGVFSVTAHRGTYPNTATNLPANRAARWWNLENDGLKQVDLTFQYVDGDITTGTESNYRAYRIPTGGGTATQVSSTINTTDKTVTAPNVSQFSDWTLAQPLAPTAAQVSVSGRVIGGSGRGIPLANVSITDPNGQTRTTRTNFFGFYRFETVSVGQTYVFNVRTNLAKFEPQVVSVNEQITDLNFSAR